MSEPTTTPTVNNADELRYLANLVRREMALIKCDLLNSQIVESKMNITEEHKKRADELRQEITEEYMVAEQAEKILQELLAGTIRMSI